MNKPAGEQPVSQTATLWVIAAVQFLTPFMFSAIGVALPALGGEFNANAVQLGLVGMVYTLGISLFLLPLGRFADIHGRKRVFLSGAAVMIAATVGLALAGSLRVLIAFRLLQGIGAAMITSTSLAILTSVFPPQQRGRAMGVVVSCVYLGVSLGPLLAGLMVEYLSWRWIFYAAVPIELAAFIYALRYLKGEWAEARGEAYDWLGATLYVPSLCALIIGTVQKGLAFGPLLAGSGLAGLLFFLWYESRIGQPLLPVKKIIQNTVFFLSNLATWLNYSASFGTMFFFSIYLQVVLGVSPKATGLILVVQPLIQALCAPLAGRLTERYQPTYIATVGMMLCTAGLVAAAFLGEQSPLGAIYPVLVLMGLGFGFFSTPNTAAIMASIDRREYGMASSLIATMRTVGMLTSMTIITILLAVYLGDQPVSPETRSAFVTTMRVAMWLFAAMGAAGVFCSCKRLPPREK